MIELVNLYQDFSENLICFSIKIQLIRLVKKDSIQIITKTLNQTLEICLKHEEIKKYQQALAGFKLPVTMHGPVFDVNAVSLDPEIGELSRQRYEQAIECALALNARFF